MDTFRGFLGAVLACTLVVSPALAGDVTVKVLATNAKAGTMKVQGPGLTKPDPDGSQTLNVGAGDAAIGYAGHTIRAELNKSDGAWRLDNIWPADAAGVTATDDAAKQIYRDLVELGRKAYRDVGDTLPAFALYNQNGELVRPETLRGKRLVMNFIFTRCANPNMCPANTQRMAQLQKEVKKAKLDDVTFVTFSFDPEHDTPGVLRQYAQAYNLDLTNFQLLTGPVAEVTEMLKQFGILLKQQDGLPPQHTMATFLVSPEGRITYRKEGELWSVDEFLERLMPPAASKNAG